MTQPTTDQHVLGMPSGVDHARPSMEGRERQVLYRKWRPQRFADVAGQEPVTTTLRHAVDARAPSHAYLFSGPRGTGKTSTGRILARAVNCDSPVDGEPDNACMTCIAFLAGEPLDLIELDAASNRGIDEIRQLRESAGISPSRSRYKVYLIDEVHMLTEPAFNALLKTLEEPPPHVIFMLATTEPHKIPSTILSRCQRFDFRRITLEAVVERLAVIAAGEGLTVAPGGLELIARQATGSLRDAVNLLDQMAAYHGRELTLEAVRAGLGLVVDDRTGTLARAAIRRDLAAGLAVLNAARDDGIEIRAFLRQVVATLRSVLMLKAGGGAELGLADGEAAELQALAAEASAAQIVAALRALGAIDFAGDAYDSLPAEIAFASLAVGLEAEARPPIEEGRSAPAVAPAARATPRPRADAGQEPPAASRPQPPAQRPRQPQSAQARREPPAPPSPPPPVGDDAPRPVARPFVPPDEGEISPQLADVRAKWGTIREAARKRHHKAGALLNTPSYIKTFDGDTLRIGFRFPMHVEQLKSLEDGKVLQAIREVVAEAVGRPVEVVPEHWPQLEQAGETVDETPREAGGHLVEEALKLGARLEPAEE